MEYSVYVLASEYDGKWYTGLSHDVQDRLKAHNSGKVKSTKGRVPFRLVYEEVVGTIREAREREKFLKSHAGRNFLKDKIKK